MTTTPAQIIARYGLPTALVRDVRAQASDRAWYTIENAASSREATVRIYDEIGFWGVTAGDFVAELDALDVDTINLRINSPGGAVWDAMAIYHTLRDHSATVNATVDGVAASAASFILQAGDSRHAHASTRVMIHQPAGGAWGNADALREYADLLNAVAVDIADIYATRAGGTAAEWLDRMAVGDTWYSATEARDIGLVDTADEATNHPTTSQPTNTIRNQEETMAPETGDELAIDIVNRLNVLERDIALANASGPASAPGHVDLSAAFAFRSYGEFVKAFARADETAIAALTQLQNAYTGPAEDDTIMRPNWLGMIIGAMRALQPTLALFTHTYDLPEQGNTLEYGKITQVKGTTGVQAQWGDTFTKDATVELDTATVNLKTIGGWAEYARQWVTRSSVSVLDLLWQGLTLSYARDIEAIARARLNTVWTARTAVGVDPIVDTGKTLATMTALDWRDVMIDIRDATYGSMWPLDGFVCSKDVYKALARLTEARPALQPRQAPTDKIGTLDLAGLSADLDGFAVTYLPGWAAGRFGGYYAGAIRVQEKPGAPLQLVGSEDITNLVKPISVWGEVADYAPIPEAILPVKFGA